MYIYICTYNHTHTYTHIYICSSRTETAQCCSRITVTSCISSYTGLDVFWRCLFYSPLWAPKVKRSRIKRIIEGFQHFLCNIRDDGPNGFSESSGPTSDKGLWMGMDHEIPPIIFYKNNYPMNYFICIARKWSISYHYNCVA